MSPISDALLRAYKETRYCVSGGDEFVMQVGHVSEPAKALMTRYSAPGAVFITAWNPFGKRSSEADNDAANSALRSALERSGLHVLEGVGVSADGRWRENSFFAFPVTRSAAVELCCRHSQNAVIFVGSDGTPELLLNPQRRFS